MQPVDCSLIVDKRDDAVASVGQRGIADGETVDMRPFFHQYVVGGKGFFRAMVIADRQIGYLSRRVNPDVRLLDAFVRIGTKYAGHGDVFKRAHTVRMHLVIGQDNRLEAVGTEDVGYIHPFYRRSAGVYSDGSPCMFRPDAVHANVRDGASAEFDQRHVVGIEGDQIVVRGALQVDDPPVVTVAGDVYPVHVSTQHIEVEGDVFNRKPVEVTTQKGKHLRVFECDVRKMQVPDIVEYHQHAEIYRRVVGIVLVFPVLMIGGGLRCIVSVPDTADHCYSVIPCDGIGIGKQVCSGAVGKTNDRVPVDIQRLSGMYFQSLPYKVTLGRFGQVYGCLSAVQ